MVLKGQPGGVEGLPSQGFKKSIQEVLELEGQGSGWEQKNRYRETEKYRNLPLRFQRSLLPTGPLPKTTEILSNSIS